MDAIQGIVWDIVGFVGATAGVLSGGSFVAGPAAAAAMVAAMGVVGGILTAVSFINIWFGVVAGAVERDVSSLYLPLTLRY
jgi:hypothetical protein